MILAIGNDELIVDVATVGARIQQIRDRTGRPWLVDTGRPEPAFDAKAVDFAEGARGGWDDCLPSIDPEPDPSAHRDVADHGDFWHRNWAVLHSDATSLSLRCAASDHPLRLTKSISVDGPTMRIHSTALNTGSDDYAFLISGHPLFDWPGDATIEIPDAGKVRYAFGVAIGASGRDVVSISRSLGPWTGKAFIRWAGVARASFAGHPGVMELRQEVTTAPWLGVCVNLASWPAHEAGPDWIALEPTTSPTDSLRAAIRSGTARSIAPGAEFSWTTTLAIEADRCDSKVDFPGGLT